MNLDGDKIVAIIAMLGALVLAIRALQASRRK